MTVPSHRFLDERLIGALNTNVRIEPRLKHGEAGGSRLWAKVEMLVVIAVGKVLDAGEDRPVIVRLPVGSDVAHGETGRWLLKQAGRDAVLRPNDAGGELDGPPRIEAGFVQANARATLQRNDLRQRLFRLQGNVAVVEKSTWPVGNPNAGCVLRCGAGGEIHRCVFDLRR